MAYKGRQKDLKNQIIGGELSFNVSELSFIDVEPTFIDSESTLETA
jgi:hypothetical protein